MPGAVGGSATTDGDGGSPKVVPEASPSAGTQDELAVSTDDRGYSISGFSDLLEGSVVGHVEDLLDDGAEVPEALHGEGKGGGAALAECALLSSDLGRPVELRLTDKGAGSEPPVTVVQFFQQAAERHASRKALCVKRVGVWKTWTYQKYYDDSVALAKAFIKVCMCSLCHFSDMACLACDNLPLGPVAGPGAVGRGLHPRVQLSGVVYCQHGRHDGRVSVVTTDSPDTFGQADLGCASSVVHSL